MRVIICGEGSHEIGYRNYWDERSKEHVALDGWMQPFVRQVLGADVEIEVLRRNDLPILPGNSQGHPRPAGHGAKALLAKLRAVAGGYDALIFMVDADSNDPKEWGRLVDEVQVGFDATAGDLLCIACVPMSASESWLMADPGAWEEFAGYDGAMLPQFPERIWGARDDPAGGHPHRFFKRVCDAAGVPDNVDTRAGLAIDTNLVTARGRCPVSLEHFLGLLELLSPA